MRGTETALRRQVVVAGIGLAVLIAAGAGVYAWSVSREPAPPVPATTTTQAAESTAAESTPAPAGTTEPSGAQTAQTEADGAALYPDDKILGSADAPVTMIEYASLTCPHCAHFHDETLPQIKANYIDKGLVRLVYRDFPLDGPALKAALLAHCVADERYFAMLDVLFRSQRDWGASADPTKALAQIGRTAGLAQEKIDACLADQAETDKIILRAQEAQASYEVQSTPSFIINGEKVAGSLPYEQFDTILKGKLP
jgi:protein-disulfide isomerase